MSERGGQQSGEGRNLSSSSAKVQSSRLSQRWCQEGRTAARLKQQIRLPPRINLEPRNGRRQPVGKEHQKSVRLSTRPEIVQGPACAAQGVTGSGDKPSSAAPSRGRKNPHAPDILAPANGHVNAGGIVASRDRKVRLGIFLSVARAA
jgi:hypothetical protein